MSLESKSNMSQNDDEIPNLSNSELEISDHEVSNSETKTTSRNEGFEKFASELNEKASNEEKLSLAIEYMRNSLSQHGEADFKGFWEARRLCLPIFKENINPIVRTKLWNDFVNLSQEARKLKDILDEEAVFAKEQLEIAIKALEDDINDYENKLKNIANIEFSVESEFLNQKFEQYNEKQRELNLLNAFAGRINSLRKEIIKIGIRLRYKSKFLKSLSLYGDKVFPKRKELIKTVSSMFVKDIDEFIGKYFGEERSSVPFFVLKNEIKALQNVAKILTLSTKAFTETRLKLSQCWDKIKASETEKKKYVLEKRKDFKDNYDIVHAKIQELEEKCKSGISSDEANSISNAIQQEMRSLELLKGDVRNLKTEIRAALAPITEKEQEEKERIRKSREEEIQKKNSAIEQILKKIDSLIKEEENYSFEDISKERESILKEIQALSLNKIEKQNIDRALKPLKDVILNKKEKSLLNLSKDELQALDQMKEILSQRIERRNEVKLQLEKYRKDLGSSGLDFEKAMMYREMMDMEKERLDKINELIDEIQEKISEIEG